MKTFPCTPAQFNALRSRLLEQGITIPSGDDGIISTETPAHIALKYHYDGDSTLTLSILEKPLFLPSAMIWEKVSEWIAA